MTSDEAIQTAIQIIGEGQPDDYVIAPTHHAQQFRDKAPGLAAILSSGELMAVAGRYENEDRDAGAAQNRFRSVFKRANATTLATAILISLVLAIGAKVVRHSRYVVFQMAAVIVPRALFQQILERISRLRASPELGRTGWPAM